jgi:hypothetical protein
MVKDLIFIKVVDPTNSQYTYIDGRPPQFEGSTIFSKLGIPSVGMTPSAHEIQNMISRLKKNSLKISTISKEAAAYQFE